MRRLTGTHWGLRLLAVTAMLSVTPAKADEATLHDVGRGIYLTGVSPSGGRIEARVGAADIRLPGERLPCANCHGKDRSGGREGGLSAPDIRWFRLSTSQPPYGPDDLVRAVTGGARPGGGTLDPAMPRYELSAADAAALAAYLGSDGDAPVPGVAADRLTIGLLLPAGQATADGGQATAALIGAVFAEANDAGGVFGRRIELDVRSETDDLRDWPVVAVLSMLPNRGSPAAFPAGVPVLGMQAPAGEPPRNGFYVLSGLEQEAAGLLLHHAAATGRPPRHGVVLHGPDPRLGAVAAAVAGRAARMGWPKPETIDLGPVAEPAALARRLEAAGTDAVLVLGGRGHLIDLLAASPAWQPQLLVAGSAEGAALFELPAAVQDRLSVAYGLLPSDWSGPDSRPFQALYGRVAAGRVAPAAAAAAHTMARTLVEALTRTGRTLTPERLTAGLEGIGQFASGSTPPLGFRPGQHVGPQGTHIVRLDLQTGRLAGPPVWVATP
ncbi:MAG TPA: ABC transporter substrate-binding protein [Azospirillum sp.]|nr:ABC transporter substrate-binding protein [Azospirillum sp.]